MKTKPISLVCGHEAKGNVNFNHVFSVCEGRLGAKNFYVVLTFIKKSRKTTQFLFNFFAFLRSLSLSSLDNSPINGTCIYVCILIV